MPSVEALLHALLPHPAVQHSHADHIVTLTNTPDGERLVREALGAGVVIVPYVMPGFDLAKAVAEDVAAGPPGRRRDGAHEPRSVHFRTRHPAPPTAAISS